MHHALDKSPLTIHLNWEKTHERSFAVGGDVADAADQVLLSTLTGSLDVDAVVVVDVDVGVVAHWTELDRRKAETKSKISGCQKHFKD